MEMLARWVTASGARCQEKVVRLLTQNSARQQEEWLHQRWGSKRNSSSWSAVLLRPKCFMAQASWPCRSCLWETTLLWYWHQFYNKHMDRSIIPGSWTAVVSPLGNQAREGSSSQARDTDWVVEVWSSGVHPPVASPPYAWEWNTSFEGPGCFGLFLLVLSF